MRTVFALFESYREANRAVEELLEKHFAGEMATVLVRSAATEQSTPTSLKEALVDFDIPKEIADFYTEGILEGGVLLWLRTKDERAGEAANVLSETKGEEVGSYT